MTRNEFMEKIRGVKASCWSKESFRSPNKPLLLLWALGRLYTAESQFVSYQEAKKPLRKLLKEFGPDRSVYHPEQPFWHLQTNELWKVPGGEVLQLDGQGSTPTGAMLARHNLTGGIPEEVYELLQSTPGLLQEAARVLLDDNFPQTTWHDDILSAVGLSLDGGGLVASGAKRSSHFRRDVLRAYGHCCAVCNFDMRLDDDLLGLEAAHIKWHAAGGPDEVANGLALCVTHHKAFDRGALGLERAEPRSYKIVVSRRVNGRSAAVRELLGLNGQSLHGPQSGDDFPDGRYIDWHRKEVFKGKAISGV